MKIAIEKFWCVKYYKAQPYNMEHTLCVCVGTGIFRNLNCYENWHLLCPFLPKYKNWIKISDVCSVINDVPLGKKNKGMHFAPVLFLFLGLFDRSIQLFE